QVVSFPEFFSWVSTQTMLIKFNQHKNRLNHQKLENCEPERKAADFRLSTRPFLSLVEKKWLAFQLLLAVKQCHEKDICHGKV
ncbi:hypothetical protein HID58_031698, partial [Brassica napus]